MPPPTTAADPTPRSTGALLVDPRFGPYVVGQWLSNTGNWFHNVAAGIVVFQLTGSNTLVGVVGGLQFVFMLLLAPYAGSLSDRVDRRRLLLVGQVVGLAGAVGIAAVALTVGLEAAGGIWPVVAATAVIGVGYAISVPTLQAYVPSLVPAVDLPQAIAVNSVTFNLARAVGPAAAGGMVAAVGVGWAFGVNALSFVVFAGVLVWLGRVGMARMGGRSAMAADAGAADDGTPTDDGGSAPPERGMAGSAPAPAQRGAGGSGSAPPERHTAGSAAASAPAERDTAGDGPAPAQGGTAGGDQDRSVLAGLRLARSDRMVAVVLLATVAVGFASDPVNTLAPALADRLGHGEWLVGAIGSAFGAGAVLSAFGNKALRERIGSRPTAIVGLLGVAAGMAAAGVAPSVPLLLGAMVLAGAGFIQAVSQLNSALQLHVADSVRGRVMALWSVAFLGVRPVAATLDGLVADAAGLGVAMAMAGAVALVGAAGLWHTRTRPTPPGSSA